MKRYLMNTKKRTNNRRNTTLTPQLPNAFTEIIAAIETQTTLNRVIQQQLLLAIAINSYLPEHTYLQESNVKVPEIDASSSLHLPDYVDIVDSHGIEASFPDTTNPNPSTNLVFSEEITFTEIVTHYFSLLKNLGNIEIISQAVDLLKLQKVNDVHVENIDFEKCLEDRSDKDIRSKGRKEDQIRGN
ncbi:32624_t:CDS:2, partial [Racocetra persica]